MEERNRYWSDEELNQMLPTENYEIIAPPEGYVCRQTPSRKTYTTPGGQSSQFYNIPDAVGRPYEVPGTPNEGPGAMPSIKPEDIGYFAPLLNQVNEDDLSLEE